MSSQLGFVHWSADQYARSLIDDDYLDVVIFGRYDAGRQVVAYAAAARWYQQQLSGPTLRLEIYHDAFMIFAAAPGLFRFLSEVLPGVANFNPVDFCAVLVEHGFVDYTDRALPEAAATCPACHRAYAERDA
jgi:hypothetical protein